MNTLLLAAFGLVALGSAIRLVLFFTNVFSNQDKAGPGNKLRGM
jgi:hypothetical protein